MTPIDAAGPILLVEDNPDDAVLAKRALRKNNVISDIVIARDGVEAIDYLFSAEQPRLLPRIILLDLKLPKVDGLEVLRRIRSGKATKLLPVIILTSSRERQDLIEGYGFGANSYIRKPVDFDQFSETMKQVAAYWLVLNEPVPLLTAADDVTPEDRRPEADDHDL